MANTDTKQTPTIKPGKDIDPTAGIQTVDDLADHLYVAAQVELSTIPLYLFSVYSIKVSGHSQWAAPRGVLHTMTGIAIEEMLHLVLVRNLMMAIGRGDYISFYDSLMVTEYPSLMLNRYNRQDTDGYTLELTLERLSTEHVKSFRRLEMPDKVDKEAEYFDAHPEDEGQYTSLGAFYRAVELGFEKLDKEIDWALDDVRRQYKRGFWNEHGNGKPIRVYDLATAKEALKIIVDQGEGTKDDHKRVTVRKGIEDFTHYEKFLRIERGEEGIGAGDGSPNTEIGIDDPRMTWPVVPNPSIDAVYAKDDPAVHSLMELFNASYCYMLCLLDEVFQHSTLDVVEKVVERDKHGKPTRAEKFSRRYELERNGIAAMQGLLYPIAQTLVKTPLKHPDYKDLNAGPPFQFYDFAAHPGSKKQQLIDLCATAIQHFPELGGPDGVHRQISLLTEV